MNFRRLLATAPLTLLLIVAPTVGAQEKHPEHPKSKAQAEGITKADLATAIKKWVEKESSGNGGWLAVNDPVAKKTLQLKLDKVHEDRLSQVAPNQYFACADFVTKDGAKYDIDVFMEGKSKDDLKETEVSVHKVNGKERYSWVEDNGIWKKKPAE
jgi:hypothetical protein